MSRISLASLLAFKFSRFALVGGGCFLLNVALLYVFKEIFHIHYLLASAIALLIVSGVGFLLNRRWTFAVKGVTFWREMGRYYVVSSGGFLLNLSLIALVVDGLKVHYLVANIGVGVSLMMVNFWLHKNWSFGSKPKNSQS